MKGGKGREGKGREELAQTSQKLVTINIMELQDTVAKTVVFFQKCCLDFYNVFRWHLKPVGYLIYHQVKEKKILLSADAFFYLCVLYGCRNK
jgi:hypothetical protein